MPDLSVRLADFNILIHAQHNYLALQCREYMLPTPLTAETADLTVEASPAEMARERENSPAGMFEGYLESICIYRAICRKLPPLGGMLLHAAVISVGENGYAFTANSGVGKTTHIKLWQKAFGDTVRIINGDKPILRKKDGKWYAYGTPWCGKEGWNINTAVPLSGICFLRRGEENTIVPYKSESAVVDIMPQILIPDDPIALMATLDMLDSIMAEIPLYVLHCTISEEAARVAHEAMKPRKD